LKYNPKLLASDLSEDNVRSTASNLGVHLKENWGLGKIQIEIFEAVVEEKLIASVIIELKFHLLITNEFSFVIYYVNDDF